MKNRKPNRLFNYDYSQNGMYFVTICTKNREELFGEIENGKIVLNDIGKIAQKCWLEIPNHFPHISLDEFIIMPNHIHGILEIINPEPVGGKNFCPLRASQDLPWQTKWARSLSSAVRGFKIGVTKWCNENNHQYFLWQRNYYDRIIRNENELNRIREYIRNNLANWERDRNNLEDIFM
jgi:REP element-mobilizing transposase RayT